MLANSDHNGLLRERISLLHSLRNYPGLGSGVIERDHQGRKYLAVVTSPIVRQMLELLLVSMKKPKLIQRPEEWLKDSE